MKLTASQLRQIIKEEVQSVMSGDEKEQLIWKTTAKYKTNPRAWQSAVNDFYDMSSGGDANGIRDEYYPGWEDEDFQRVIDAVQQHRRESISKR